jgi:Ni/Co efflux regulator RcnB
MEFRISAAVCALALATTITSVGAQEPSSNRRSQPSYSRANEGRPESTQFDDHARQTVRDWYGQHQNRPPAGLRPQDRLSAAQESRLQPGRRLDPALRQREHAVPGDLSRRLPPPPPNHRYVAIGGHVGLVDDVNHILRDVIHLHNQ